MGALEMIFTYTPGGDLMKTCCTKLYDQLLINNEDFSMLKDDDPDYATLCKFTVTSLLRVCSSEEQLKELYEILVTAGAYGELTIDQSWQLANKMCAFPDILQFERNAFIADVQKRDPEKVIKQSLRQEMLLKNSQEDIEAAWEMIRTKSKDISIANYSWIFLGFNTRRDINRKMLLTGFFDIVDEIYAHGEFYFKYFNWYMTPKAVNVEEITELIANYEAVLERTDKSQSQLIRAIQTKVENEKKRLKVF